MVERHILLIQPPLLQPTMEADVIQNRYWEVLSESVHNLLVRKGLIKTLNEYDKNFSGFIEPNIGLLYIAAAIRNKGYKIHYIDAHLDDAKIRSEQGRVIAIEDIQQALAALPTEALRVVAISPLTVNFKWAIRIAEAVKALNKEAVIVLGGVHASFDYKNILEKYDCVDVISVGEGEQSAVELLDVLYENDMNVEAVQHVKGMAIRRNGRVLFTGARPDIQDLDMLSYPMYELFPPDIMQNYMIRVITSRGCTHNCSFCVPSKFFNRLRFRDPVKVVDEMQHYYELYGCRTFMIGDLNFLSSYRKAKIFCEELARREMDIVWMCQSRVDLIRQEIVELMSNAGCIMICLGIESAGQEILDNTNKRTTLDRCMEACKIVKEAGIGLFTFWVFGLPGETHDSAHATIKLLRKMLDDKLIDYTHCTTCVPFPGTDLFLNPEKNKIKILSYDFDDYWMGCDYLGAGLPVMETEQLSNYEIYAYWQMALAVVAGQLLKNPEEGDIAYGEASTLQLEGRH
ncbi:B12-binding domain-containing radical SAM protein [Paenibacillus massiliensis]|uniref:B12-binding domain-containing radical SAM protein n=1 Tax=Paenibacillus massiliensis TaxID=225917 RepID=UPI0003786F07|nr:radical SAM protein [Paenibacillus massiliensis]